MRKILVVDDNILDRKLITKKLSVEFTRLEISEAANGLVALEFLLHKEFDLIITDLVMPKMEGIEFMQNLRRMKRNIPLFAVSGANPYYLYLAKKIGAAKIFTKPLPLNEFIVSVANQLNLEHRIVA